MLWSATYRRDDAAFSEAASSVLALCGTATDIDLAQNYTPERLRLDRALCISLYRDHTEVVGFSTAMHIPLFGNAARVLNRFYRHPDHRGGRRPWVVNDATKDMVGQQIAAVAAAGFDFAFMSRETADVAAMRHYTKQLRQQWVEAPDRYMVCAADTASCWQRIAYYRIRTGPSIPDVLNTRLSNREFKDRYGDALL